jgi:hypothetical protein
VRLLNLRFLNELAATNDRNLKFAALVQVQFDEPPVGSTSTEPAKDKRSAAAAALRLRISTDINKLSDVAGRNPRVSYCHNSRLCSLIIKIEPLWTGQGRICLILPPAHPRTIY